MTTTEFKRQMKAAGWEVSKLRKLEVFEVELDGSYMFRVTFAELYPVVTIHDLIAQKLRPEYIPPLG